MKNIYNLSHKVVYIYVVAACFLLLLLPSCQGDGNVKFAERNNYIMTSLKKYLWHYGCLVYIKKKREVYLLQIYLNSVEYMMTRNTKMILCQHVLIINAIFFNTVTFCDFLWLFMTFCVLLCFSNYDIE